MTLDELIQDRLPRKGLTFWPLAPPSRSSRSRKAPWTVRANLHEIATEHGYLTGALFERHGAKSLKLLLVGPCPWTPGALRYYAIPLSEDEANRCLAGPAHTE